MANLTMDNEKEAVPRHELEVSAAAGTLFGKLHEALRKEYIDPNAPSTLHSLNVLCVRLVFCLYAEDSGIFPLHAQFHDYWEDFLVEHMRVGLLALFTVLDQKSEERDPYLSPDLAAFPYMNSELFKEKDIEVPLFTEEIRDLLLKEASESIDWREVRPAIFGAAFKNSLNQETCLSGDMDYMSIPDTHKVIDPQFLTDLQAELDSILVRETESGNSDNDC